MAKHGMFEVKVTGTFSASHRLRGYKGKCESLHGHNWKVEVVASSRTLNRLGMVEDFCRLKKVLGETLRALDHRDLNAVPYFRKKNPTSENIAYFVFCSFKKKAPRINLARVCVWETEPSCATYEEA